MVNGELREHLAGLIGVDTTRYGPRSDRGLRKQDILVLAGVLNVGPEEDQSLTLEELYRRVCKASSVEYNATAGNQWSLGRRQLKAIIRAVEAER